VLILSAGLIGLAVIRTENISNINHKKDLSLKKVVSLSKPINYNVKPGKVNIAENSKSIKKSEPYDTDVTLYFVNTKVNDYEFVKEVHKVKVENGEIAKAAINELLKGSDEYGQTIPKGTKLLSINLKNTTIYVDFSKEFIENNNLGSGYELQMIYSIVNTLTEFKSVKQVQFLVEGKIEPANKHVVMEQPFKRNLIPIK
jgi:spore germination protein GerM